MPPTGGIVVLEHCRACPCKSDKLSTLANEGSLETFFVLSEGKVETAYALEADSRKRKGQK